MGKITQYANLASGDVAAVSWEADDMFVDQTTDIASLHNSIDLNQTTPLFRINVLYADETVNYEIPQSDIKVGGNYNENYQNGQRRSISFTLYNDDGKYNPNINTLWAGTRLRLDMGLNLLNGQTLWFYKGYYIINKITPSLTATGKEVAISATDKFSLFENSTGRLEDTYKIDSGVDIREVIEAIQQAELGNGYVFDPKPLIYHSSFEGKQTQIEISKSAGDTYGSILLDLATQLSAEIFYNANGNLVLTPISEVTNDDDKPLVYNYYTEHGDMSQLNFDYDYNSIVNRIIVIGSSSNGGVYKAVAINSDESSPLCYQRIGYRTGNIINDSNISSDILAEERALYELRQQLILKTTTSSNVLFNPFLSVNNLISVSDPFFNLEHERYLIQSISCSLDYSGSMSISFTNLNNITTDIEIISAITPKTIPNYDMTTVSYMFNIITHKYVSDILLSANGPTIFDPHSAETYQPNGTSYKYGATIYIYAWVDTQYYAPPSTEWQLVEPWADGNKRLYQIKFLKTIYPEFGNEDGSVTIKDISGSGRGIQITDASAIQPVINVKLEVEAHNTANNNAMQILYKYAHSRDAFNTLSINQKTASMQCNSGTSIEWYGSLQSPNYTFSSNVTESPGSSFDTRETLIDLLSPTIMTGNIPNQTYDRTLKFDVTRIPAPINVSFNGVAQSDKYNFLIDSTVKEFTLTCVSQEPNEEEKVTMKTFNTSGSLEGCYSGNKYGSGVNEYGYIYSYHIIPHNIKYREKIVIGGHLFPLNDSIDVKFLDSDLKPIYKVTCRLGIGVSSYLVTYTNPNGQEVTEVITEDNTIKYAIEGTQCTWSNVTAKSGYDNPTATTQRTVYVNQDQELTPPIRGWWTVYMSGDDGYPLTPGHYEYDPETGGMRIVGGATGHYKDGEPYPVDVASVPGVYKNSPTRIWGYGPNGNRSSFDNVELGQGVTVYDGGFSTKHWLAVATGQTTINLWCWTDTLWWHNNSIVELYIDRVDQYLERYVENKFND